jgi:hypothetical protein
MPDGPPQISAVFRAQCARSGNRLFGLIKTEITLLLILRRDELKPNNMLSDHKIAATVVNAENPHQQVMIRGSVVEITHEGADKCIDSLAKKYLGVDKYPHRAPGEQRVIGRIIPDHISTTGDEEPA